MRGRCKGTLVGKSRDLLGDYRVFLDTGARSAHALQRRLGNHLVNKQHVNNITQHLTFHVQAESNDRVSRSDRQFRETRILFFRKMKERK